MSCPLYKPSRHGRYQIYFPSSILHLRPSTSDVSFTSQDELDDDRFENFKNGLVARLLEKCPSLTNEANKYWEEIVNRGFMFDFHSKEAEEVNRIKKQDMIEWYETYLRQPKGQRLVVRVWGCDTPITKMKAPGQRSYQTKSDKPLRALSNQLCIIDLM